MGVAVMQNLFYNLVAPINLVNKKHKQFEELPVLNNWNDFCVYLYRIWYYRWYMKQFILTIFLGLSMLCTQAQGPIAVQSQQAEKNKLGLEDKDISIYPNPSSNGIFTISADNVSAKKIELRIMNVIGNEVLREVYSNLDGSFSKTVDLNNFAKGLYYVKLETDQFSVVRRVILK